MEHKLNVLLINGSPNAKGCTYTALSEVERTLQAEGISTEMVHIGNRDIRGCIACFKCAETGRCVFNDMVNELAPKFEAADGLVVGSPVYYAGPNGTLTNLLDRLFFILHRLLGVAAVHHIPVAAADDGHLADGEVFV